MKGRKVGKKEIYGFSDLFTIFASRTIEFILFLYSICFAPLCWPDLFIVKIDIKINFFVYTRKAGITGGFRGYGIPPMAAKKFRRENKGRFMETKDPDIGLAVWVIA